MSTTDDPAGGTGPPRRRRRRATSGQGAPPRPAQRIEPAQPQEPTQPAQPTEKPRKPRKPRTPKAGKQSQVAAKSTRAPAAPTPVVETEAAPSTKQNAETPRRRRPPRDNGERGMRDLAGAGPSQVGVSGALRARDVNRPTEADLAEAEREVVIVRRPWDAAQTPPSRPKRG